MDANGVRLAPGTEYFWTVRTWDRAGRVGPFAPPDELRRRSRRRRLARELDPAARSSIPRRARTSLSARTGSVTSRASPIVRAVAYVSAGQQYDLRVNGVRVAHGPSFSYPDQQYYEATDVRAQLRAGTTNAIGIISHWESPGQGRPASVPGAHRADHGRARRRDARGHHDRRDLARPRGAVAAGAVAQQRRRPRRARRRTRRSGRLGPARLRRPRLGARRRARTASRRTVPAPDRGAQSHRRAPRPGPHAGAARPTARTSPTSAPVIAATPVVTLQHGSPGPRGQGDGRLPARPRRPRLDDARHATDRHALGLRRARRRADSSGRSTISASGTSRSTGANEHAVARRRGGRRAPRRDAR